MFNEENAGLCWDQRFLLMGFEKLLDFRDNLFWIIDVAGQLFHGAPAVTSTIDDVVNQLAVIGIYPMGMQ